MTNDNSNHDHDISTRYRATATEAPPPALDAAILAAAREQTARQRSARRPWWARWMVPMSVAATVVIGVSVTLLVEREHPEAVDTTRFPSSPAPPETPATAKKSASAVKQAETRHKAHDSGPSALKDAESITPQTVPSSPPKRDAMRDGPSRQVPAPESDALDKPGKLENKVGQSAQMKRKEADLRRDAAGQLGSAGVAGVGAAESSVAAPAKGAPADAAPRPASEPTRLRAQMAPSPETWLERIRQLKRTGREADALTQMAAFRKIYPNANIPDDLKDLIRPSN